MSLCSLKGDSMAAKPYTAMVVAGGQTFVCTVPLTDDEYAEFLLREFNATEYTLGLLRENQTCQGLDFNEANVTLHPQA